MPQLTVNGVAIDDTFAEAFDMRATAIVITAPTARWAGQAATTMTGFATSVIACGCEASDRERSIAATDAGRTARRARADVRGLDRGTAETTCKIASGNACSPAPVRPATRDSTGDDKLKLGDAIRFFGDGWQIAKRLGGRRYWRVPVMDGEFVCESTTYLTKKAVGGGNLIVMGAQPGEDARGDRGGGGGDAQGRGRHHAVSRRHRALGIEGRLEIQGRERLDQRCLLPDFEGRGRQRRSTPKSPRCSRSSSTA